MMVKGNKLVDFVLGCICIMINLSQLPVFVENETTNILSTTAIGIVVAYMVLRPATYRVEYGPTARKVFTMTFVFFVIQSLVYWLNVELDYFEGSFPKAFYITIVLYFVGYILGDNYTERTSKWISGCYIISVCVLAVVIFENYLLSSWDSRMYAYTSKNSVSMNIFIAVVLLGMASSPKVKILNLMKVALIAALTIVVFMLKSRATILCYIIVVVYLFLQSNISLMKKVFAILFICVIGLVLIVEQNVINSFIENVILAKRDFTDINDVSSGRVDILRSFPTTIDGKWFSGIGNIYFECFYLSAILNFGILGGVCIICYALHPLKWILGIDRNTKDLNCFAIIVISLCVNGLFEGLAPFGPGGKCYWMWLMFGLLSRIEDMKLMQKTKMQIGGKNDI